MVNPELYNKSNSLTKAAAIQCLQEYLPKLNWKEYGESIVDLGCGDGSVTCLLKNYIPSNYDKFVGCDINKDMIQFASEQYSDKNITFRVLDVAGDIPDDMRCDFGHVFSFFLLHWIEDQQRAFRNIYNLMKEGGECLLTIAGYNPISYLYDVIGRDKTNKWSSEWFKGSGNFVSMQYVYMKDGDKFITEIMEKCGFVDIEVQFKKRTYVFENIVGLKQFMKAVEPYQMPDAVFEKFFHDFIALGKNKNIFDKSLKDMNDTNMNVNYNYEMYVVHASKRK